MANIGRDNYGHITSINLIWNDYDVESVMDTMNTMNMEHITLSKKK